MKRMLLFLILLTLCPLYGGEEEESIEILNQMNSGQMGDANYSSTCDASCGMDILSNEDLMNQCAIDLCGDPKKLNSVQLLDHNVDQYVSNSVLKKFSKLEPQIQEMLESEVDRNKKIIEEFKKRNQEQPFSPNMEKWQAWEYDRAAVDLFGSRFTMEMNLEVVDTERLKIEPLEDPSKGEKFNQALREYVDVIRSQMEESTSIRLSMGFYSLEESKTIYEKAWRDLERKITKIREVKPDFLKDEQKTLNAIKKRVHKMNVKRPYDIIEDIGSMERLMDAVHYEETGVIKKPKIRSVCGSDVCREGVREYYSKLDYQKMFEDFEKANNNPNLIKEKMSKCKSEFAMLGLKKRRTKEFKRLFPEIKKNFLSNVVKNYSRKSYKNFEDYLNNELNLSFDLDENEDDLTQFSRRVKDQYGRYLDGKSRQPQGAEVTERDLYETAVFKRSENKASPLGTWATCGNSFGVTAWDAFGMKEVFQKRPEYGELGDIDIERDNIRVSRFSCTQIAEGKNIFVHELGHAMSKEFSRKNMSEKSYEKFIKERSCVKAYYKDLPPGSKNAELYHEGDGLRTEEDMADLISYKVYPESSELYSCSLMATSFDGSQYDSISLKNPLEFDPHSSALMRTLREAVYKKRKLSSACNEVINRFKDDYRFDPCD